MSGDLFMAIGLVLGVLVFLGFGLAAMLTRFYRKVEQGQALLINKTANNIVVSFTGGVVLPVVHRAEVMDISVKTIQVERRGNDGLICADNIRADIQVTFYVQVNRKEEDVLTVAQRVGCARASDPRTLQDLYAAKFSEALKTVGKRMEFEQLYTHRSHFKDSIIEVIGRDLDGYVLADCAIDYLEQTPVAQLDPNNILDAHGIRKITEITAAQSVNTNELRQEQRKAISKQNLEADEAVLELEKRKAEAVARQQREVATIQARESAETSSVQAEQKRLSELARLKSEEDVAIAGLNKQRQVEVADKDRERVLGIKEEQVHKDRELEKISREREVELQRIEKEKALEVQRKEIADVVRTRIAVDKTVAEEEERIKDLRASADALRRKNVTITDAEARAQEEGVKSIQAAAADEKVAEHKARERLTLANAALESADKESKAKVRLAEGVQAEAAAEGLAHARVQEAEAVALQKRGQAEAVVLLEKKKSEAQGEAAQGEVKVRLREQGIALTEREGLVGATVLKAQKLAEAEGEEQQGLAKVRVGEADARVVRERGAAEASALQAKLLAEAAGIAEKAQAMGRLTGEAREHEELRLRVEMERTVALARLEAQKAVAAAQAQVLGEAFGHADIRLVGGDGGLFERIASSISMGQAIDQTVGNSETLQKLLAPYLSGDRQLPDDLAAMVGQIAGSGAKDLVATAALARLASKSDAG